ncbi:hypothetical protein D779_2076 [Imhoffiella purpurea]|uniref:Uncharacterized protein n=1 Tax=Imhoffiella purpurea TaxID=1249627 RepID=W9VWT7_9GAMM|nr:hypothetical protein D779_2076 [Imhoffiella purpurea]
MDELLEAIESSKKGLVVADEVAQQYFGGVALEIDHVPVNSLEDVE